MPRLAATYVRHALRSPALWGLVALVAGYGTVAVLAETGAVALGSGLAASAELGLATGLQVLWLLALALPLAAGGAAASRRVSGYALLQRARGLNAAALVTAELAASLAVACITVTAVSACIALAAVVRWPSAPVAQPAIGFSPVLLARSPTLWLLSVAGIYALACAAMLGTSVLLGSRLSSAAAAALPPVGVLALGFAMTGPLWPANPLERLSFLQLHGAAWTTPGSMAAYWACSFAGVLFTALALSVRRDA